MRTALGGIEPVALNCEHCTPTILLQSSLAPAPARWIQSLEKIYTHRLSGRLLYFCYDCLVWHRNGRLLHEPLVPVKIPRIHSPQFISVRRYGMYVAAVFHRESDYDACCPWISSTRFQAQAVRRLLARDANAIESISEALVHDDTA